MEVLRRSNVPKSILEGILNDFMTVKFYIAPLEIEHIAKSVKLSLESDIHIYNYLVVILLEDIVSKIYSADKHFMHMHFTKLAKNRNLLEP